LKVKDACAESPIVNGINFYKATRFDPDVCRDDTAYAYGGRVIMKAVPDPGYEFAGWSGGLFRQENPTVMIIHADRSITTNFPAIGSALRKGKYVVHTRILNATR
jgi:hypothetical protein